MREMQQSNVEADTAPGKTAKLKQQDNFNSSVNPQLLLMGGKGEGVGVGFVGPTTYFLITLTL